MELLKCTIPYLYLILVLLRIWLGTYADDLFIIHLIVNITSRREEGERQEQEQGNAHVHPAPRTVFISVSSSNLQNTRVGMLQGTHGRDVVPTVPVPTVVKSVVIDG